MESLYLLLAVHCCVTLLYAAPLPQHDALTRVVERGVSLVKKILNDIPRVHEAYVKKTGLDLELSSESHDLEYLLSDFGIPAPPVLKSISEEFTLTMSLSHMVEGLDLHHELLQDIMSSTETRDSLLADIKELADQIKEMQKLVQIPVTVCKRNLPDFSSRLNSNYKVQVAAHLSLQQLNRFTQAVFRGLRHIANLNQFCAKPQNLLDKQCVW